MIEQLRAELSDLAAKLERQKKIETMLRDIYNEQQQLMQRDRLLKEAFMKEKADVDRLERTSAASIFYSLFGHIDKKLDKEQKEAFTARLKYEAAARQLDDCAKRLEGLLQEKESLAECESHYSKVFAKIQKLLHEDPAYAERLCALEHSRGEILAQLKELDEAILAGNAAMRQIGAIEDCLKSAEGWGKWDMFGGGLLADMAKHSHLDNAQSNAEHLQVLLSRFKTELADVRINAQLGAVRIDGFLRFADYFFDGLITDWTVLSRIHESQNSVQNVRQQVGTALTTLYGLQNECAAEKDAVEKQITELVTKK